LALIMRSLKALQEGADHVTTLRIRPGLRISA